MVNALVEIDIIKIVANDISVYTFTAGYRTQAFKGIYVFDFVVLIEVIEGSDDVFGSIEKAVHENGVSWVGCKGQRSLAEKIL